MAMAVKRLERGGDCQESRAEIKRRPVSIRLRAQLNNASPQSSGISRSISAELNDFPCASTASDDAAFERAGYAPVPTCEPTCMMMAVAMVRAGLGVTILPRSAREVRAEPALVARLSMNRVSFAPSRS
jgi:DNA-binding transcriptional LysR family regulator